MDEDSQLSRTDPAPGEAEGTDQADGTDEFAETEGTDEFGEFDGTDEFDEFDETDEFGEADRAALEAAVQEGLPAAIDAYVDVARERVTVPYAELEELVATRIGLDPADLLVEHLIGAAENVLMQDPGAPTTLLAGDAVVHAPALVDGAVFTHRLSASEQAEGYLVLDTDLAGFLRLPQPRVVQPHGVQSRVAAGPSAQSRVAAGPLSVDDGADPIVWHGPDDWLAGLPHGAVLAVRADADGEVTIDVLEESPAAAPELVARLRATYDAEVAEPGLPVNAEDLVLGILLRDRDAFAATPRPPLTELAEAAGLQRRGHEFAHDDEIWERAAELDREFRLMHRFGDEAACGAALEALDLLTNAEGHAAMRRALELLDDPEVLRAVTDELLAPEDDPGRVAVLVALGDRLLAAAGNGPRAAVAGWVAAVAAERDGRPGDAEAHLRAASWSGGGWEVVEDRLAWYESDRGDAAAALARWHAAGATDEDLDVAAVGPFATARGPEPGRNQPCWCGSGRKYKQCHQGRAVLAPLPERVGWLYRKAVAHLLRRGGTSEAALMAHAEVLAGYDGGDEEDGEEDGGAAGVFSDLDLGGDAAGDRGTELVADLIGDLAYDDPLVADTVLHEGGWFARFLAERGPLLPADEAALAATWPAVERTVYEVAQAGPTPRVRDLRTGEHLDVGAAGPLAEGDLLCARAVPDGGGHRFVGAVEPVPAGHEEELLELLAGRDGFALLEWIAGLRRGDQVRGDQARE